MSLDNFMGPNGGQWTPEKSEGKGLAKYKIKLLRKKCDFLPHLICLSTQVACPNANMGARAREGGWENRMPVVALEIIYLVQEREI